MLTQRWRGRDDLEEYIVLMLLRNILNVITYEQRRDGSSVTMESVDSDAIVSAKHTNGVVLRTSQQPTSLMRMRK